MNTVSVTKVAVQRQKIAEERKASKLNEMPGTKKDYQKKCWNIRLQQSKKDKAEQKARL